MISEELKEALRKELSKRSPYFLDVLRGKLGDENRKHLKMKERYDRINKRTRKYYPGKS